MKELTRDEIELIFSLSKKLEPIVRKREGSRLLKGKLLATLFFQPSTRTRLSFESAMQRLGGSVIGFADAGVSRAGDAYGETLEDTARMIQLYADTVVIRHSQVGVPRLFADYCTIPVLNGGDGYGDQAEHPTQAMLDLYTIFKEKGKIDGLNVVFWGDMNQRTMHSLAYGLAKFHDVRLSVFCPDELRFPEKVEQDLRRMGAEYNYISSFEDIAPEADVIYILGPKKSRAELPTEDEFRLTAGRLANAKAKRDLIVLHPFPRLDELATDVDNTAHAKYFDQPLYGISIRMSLLVLVMGKTRNLIKAFS